MQPATGMPPPGPGNTAGPTVHGGDPATVCGVCQEIQATLEEEPILLGVQAQRLTGIEPGTAVGQVQIRLIDKNPRPGMRWISSSSRWPRQR